MGDANDRASIFAEAPENSIDPETAVATEAAC